MTRTNNILRSFHECCNSSGMLLLVHSSLHSFEVSNSLPLATFYLCFIETSSKLSCAVSFSLIMHDEKSLDEINKTLPSERLNSL